MNAAQKVINNAIGELEQDEKVQAYNQLKEVQKILAGNSLMGNDQPRKTPHVIRRRNTTVKKTKIEAREARLRLKSALRQNGPMTMVELTRVLCPTGKKSGRKYHREYGFVDSLVRSRELIKEDGLVTIA